MNGRRHGVRMMRANVVMPMVLAVHDVVGRHRGRVMHGGRGGMRRGRHIGSKSRPGQEPSEEKGQKLGYFGSFQEVVQRSRWIAN
jgi:hypothetical protein